MVNSDVELMDRVKSGDSEAFTQIDAKWRPVLMGLMQRRVGNVADAEDLVQRTLFRCWQKCQMFDPATGPLSAWICRMANNVLIDSVRSKKRKVRGGGIIHEAIETHEIARYDSRIDQIADDEIRNKVRETVRSVVQSMPRDLRQVCNGFMAGKTIVGVGDTLALSRTTVSVRLSTARERMRNSIALIKANWAEPEFDMIENTDEKKVQLQLF